MFIYFTRITNSQCLQVALLWCLTFTKSFKYDMLVMMTLFLLKVFTDYKRWIHMHPNFTEDNESWNVGHGDLLKNQRLSRACIVHLVIKKTNWSYVKTMSCSGSHLGITINIKNTKFVKDLPMIDAQFRFNQCNSFREEYISVFSPYGPVLILWTVVAAILDFRSA